jgi:hypothetical protein
MVFISYLLGGRRAGREAFYMAFCVSFLRKTGFVHTKSGGGVLGVVA